MYTGLRISDVVLFDIERLHGNQVFLHAKKNGGDVFTYIPDWLSDRLNRACQASWETAIPDRRHEASRYGHRHLAATTGQGVRARGCWRRTCHAAPVPTHLARILLERGVPVADVADLLGDDEKTVREHYARWVPERQARLTKILKEAFGDKPRLIPIQGGRGLTLWPTGDGDSRRREAARAGIPGAHWQAAASPARLSSSRRRGFSAGRWRSASSK